MFHCTFGHGTVLFSVADLIYLLTLTKLPWLLCTVSSTQVIRSDIWLGTHGEGEDTGYYNARKTSKIVGQDSGSVLCLLGCQSTGLGVQHIPYKS